MLMLPLPALLLTFAMSLLITLRASTWFTRTLEAISDIFDLSASLLSLLGALGANIPNYAASIVAIAGDQFAVGLGIIIGSNIYNIAIILAISTFAMPSKQGITLTHKEASDARLVAIYTLSIMLSTLVGVCLLSFLPFHLAGATTFLIPIVLIITNIGTLGFFAALSYHALHRVHHTEDAVATTEEISQHKILSLARVRIIGMAILALGIALGGVVVMVQSGQAAAAVVHMPPAILGLFVLAVATSLPNTVVAFTLARTNRATACVEEVLSSNSINAAFGIALPLLIWHYTLHDQLLLFLDTPLMTALTLVTLLCIMRKCLNRNVSLMLLGVYVVWIGVHLLA